MRTNSPVLRSTVHEPTEDCWLFHCWFHGVDEAVGIRFKHCIECGHTYKTAGALRRAWRREMPADVATAGLRFWAKLTVRVKNIGFCPFCIHDF